MTAEQQFDRVCKVKMEDIQNKLNKVEEDTQYLRMKVDNGLSTLPKKMNWMIGFLFTTIVGLIAMAYFVGSTQAHLETMIEFALEED